jgi:hypothetical protein
MEYEMLGASSRQEVLRRLVANPKIIRYLPELKRLRRQGGFFRKLDRAVQAARLVASHADEEEVLTERLRQRLTPSEYRPVRDEVLMLSRAYEAWLEAHPSPLSDSARCLRDATGELAARGWPKTLPKPDTLLYFTTAVPESLERSFCEELARHFSFKRVGPLEGASTNSLDLGNVDFIWEKWHTLDDAAESLADRLVDRLGELPLSEQVILIPDDAGVRRSLKRAMDSRGILNADGRDPNRLRWDETLKWALLPLEVVTSDFEREKVAAFVEDSAARAEMANRGIRQGILSYQGGPLAETHRALAALQAGLGGRKTLKEFSEFHLAITRARAARKPECAWILGFLEKIWSEVAVDQLRFERETLKAPSRYWFERFTAATTDAPAPMEPLKATDGVQVFRLHQASLLSFKKVWIFGVPADFLSNTSVGDYALSEREREILSGEFGVRSGLEARRERHSALSAWLAGAKEVVLLDAHYDWDARERESLAPLLVEWFGELKHQPIERGSHSRFTPSYASVRPLPAQVIALPPLPRMSEGGLPQITASDLDRYSRCAFQALGYQRWRINDQRTPESDLWPDVKGNILHQAVRKILESRDEEARPLIEPDQAIEQVWGKCRPKGLLEGRRIESYAKFRLEKVLRVFLEKEGEFQARAGTRTLILDDQIKFRIDLGEFLVKGTPDRIEESNDGLFVMDYKTASASPNGTEMIELGYRLQLPFYAIAAQRVLNKPVIGLQFVELNRKGSRSSGIFFPYYNGKEPGKLTKAAPNSKSLIKNESPEDVWARMKEHVLVAGRAFVAGQFAAAPKRGEKECASCGLSDLCGFRRKSADALAEDSES